jgi:DNA-binding transcriptional ArsR family regulator
VLSVRSEEPRGRTSGHFWSLLTRTGMKKHVHVLEDAGLVTTEKVGRVRICRLGPRQLEDESAWMEKYRQMLEEHTPPPLAPARGPLQDAFWP